LALSAPHPLSCMSYLFLLLITRFLFFFFPRWRSVCPGGCAALGQACLWEYCSTAKLTWSASSQAVWELVTGSPGALLVSLFKVKWRFSALAGGVEGSKLCLFSVIMPAKCVSGVSPRFHYWRLAFCFLPLAAILEKKPSYPYSYPLHFPSFSCTTIHCSLSQILFLPLLMHSVPSSSPLPILPQLVTTVLFTPTHSPSTD
jgi:hypothetical protein